MLCLGFLWGSSIKLQRSLQLECCCVKRLESSGPTAWYHKHSWWCVKDADASDCHSGTWRWGKACLWTAGVIPLTVTPIDLSPWVRVGVHVCFWRRQCVHMSGPQGGWFKRHYPALQVKGLKKFKYVNKSSEMSISFVFFPLLSIIISYSKSLLVNNHKYTSHFI